MSKDVGGFQDQISKVPERKDRFFVLICRNGRYYALIKHRRRSGEEVIRIIRLASQNFPRS